LIKKKKNKMNDVATYLPILQCIVDHTTCDTIFQFGLGNSSTKLFAERYSKVIAVEMDDETLFETIKELNFPSHVHLYCALGHQPGIDILNSLFQDKFSCIFVDGHAENRWQCINESFAKTDVIVTHDTEKIWCNWNLVKKPSHFIWMDIKQYNPWTSVLTCNHDIVRFLVKKFPSSYTLRD
jgi:hypothetical protein